jgi:hypothetical protein
MATEVGQLVLKVDTTGVKAAEGAVERLGDAAQDTTAKTQTMSKVSKTSNVTVGNFGRTAGMAGIQFEQLAGQIAGGQNPMRAVGVQAADLGFVLGVPLLGAVVGIGAALGSVLIPMLMDTEKSVEELQDSLEEISDVMAKKAANGADILSERFLNLARSSRQLAEIELRVKMIDAMQNVTAAQAALMDSTDGLRVSIEQFSQKSGNQPSRSLRVFSEEMGISKDRAIALQEAIDGMRAGNEGAQQSFIDLVADAMATEEVTPKFAALAQKVLTSALAMNTASEQAEFLKTALTDLDAALAESGEEFQTSSEVSAVAAEKMVDRIIAANDTRIEAIERNERDSLITVNELRAEELISAQEHQEAIAAILAVGRDARRELEVSEQQEKLDRLHATNEHEMQVLIAGEEKKRETARQTTDALLAFEDVLMKGKSEKQKAAFRLGVNLMNAEKRENAKNIISSSYDAAMKAYKALAGIPIVGPALGAAAAATILAAGVSFAAQSLQGRALGGQVRAGESYVVGERGPEVLTMGTGGRITPNEALGGGTTSVNKTANVSFNISANDTQGFDELLVNRRGLIISMINEAVEDQGRAAIV